MSFISFCMYFRSLYIYMKFLKRTNKIKTGKQCLGRLSAQGHGLLAQRPKPAGAARTCHGWSSWPLPARWHGYSRCAGEGWWLTVQRGDGEGAVTVPSGGVLSSVDFSSGRWWVLAAQQHGEKEGRGEAHGKRRQNDSEARLTEGGGGGSAPVRFRGGGFPAVSLGQEARGEGDSGAWVLGGRRMGVAKIQWGGRWWPFKVGRHTSWRGAEVGGGGSGRVVAKVSRGRRPWAKLRANFTGVASHGRAVVLVSRHGL
jgi:hypothetical protein